MGTWLTGCGRLTANEITPTASPDAITATTSANATATSLPSATPTIEPSPTEVASHSKIQYQIGVDFDFNRHTLQVTQQVTFNNPGPDAYPDLVFAVEPNLEPGVFTLKSLTLGGDTGITGYDLAKNRLDVTPGRPMQPGETWTARFEFELSLPAIPPPSEMFKPVIFGYTDRQTNLVDWYPFLVPYEPGKGWIIHNPGYFGEHLVYPSADFDVTINLINPPAGLIIASAHEVVSNNHYVLNQARTFAWSASTSYNLMTASAGDVTVTSYSFPQDDEAAKMVLQNTADALSLYSRLFGPYQHAALTVVEGDFLDGMEYDGLYFLSKGFYNLYDGTPKGYLTLIAVHETSHQWWFGQVGNDQALEPWLDEALATYTEEIFYENVYPDLVSWWWDYRVNYYQPVGMINLSVYEYNGFTPYRNAVYLRGAQFLDALRKQIGDDAFFAFLKDYVATEKYQVATADDFFTILARHTDQDISKLKSQYFK
jgi:hypothetical protein